MSGPQAFELPERNPNPVFVLSPTGEVDYYNEAAAHVLSAWRRDPATAWREIVLAAKAPEGREAAVEGRWYRFRAVEAGTRLHVYGFDVTECRALVEAAEESRRLASLGAVAAGVAHDFNNVLSVVVGCVDLLARTPLSSEARACTETLADVCDRASWLTRQLLGFNGRLVLRPDRVDLSEFVRRCEPLVRRSAPAGVRVVCEVPAEPVETHVDSRALFQVLLNLVTNAAQALDEGRGLLVVSVERTRDQRPALRVTDTGRGIAPAVLPRIFEPFFTTRGDGTGLGLATSRELVEQAGGTIEVESTLGRGSTFRVVLPSADGPRTSSRDEPASAAT